MSAPEQGALSGMVCWSLRHRRPLTQGFNCFTLCFSSHLGKLTRGVVVVGRFRLSIKVGVAHPRGPPAVSGRASETVTAEVH